jgi:hypothetical protein
MSGVALVAVDMVRNEQWDGLCRRTRGNDSCRCKEIAGQNESVE